jgi:glycosyltransferase involved in cell wall biosynthesis
MVKKRYAIPYVVSLRGGDVPGFRPYDFRFYHKLIGPLLHRIWKDASAVVANSKGLQQLALEFDSKTSVAIVPNGVEVADYEVEQRTWSPAHLLSVGRVVHQKGMDLGLEALAGLKDLEWEWSIVGDGPQAPMLQEKTRALGLETRVHFLGWLSRDQLPAAYRRSNLFLFPSRHEGMPNALLESMASGLPAVATRIAGNDELILDGLTGKLVYPEDPGALQSALRELIPAEKLRREMGQAARERAASDYSWERAAEQYLDLLSTALVSS